MASLSHHWSGIPKNFSPDKEVGFVYLITNTSNNRKYVGRKYFWSVRKTKVKGKKRKVKVKKESDWRTYRSSCEDLKRDIQTLGENSFKFEILSLHFSKAATNYTEVKEQFARDVLYAKFSNGEFEYYNTNILARYYRSRKTP